MRKVGVGAKARGEAASATVIVLTTPRIHLLFEQYCAQEVGRNKGRKGGIFKFLWRQSHGDALTENLRREGAKKYCLHKTGGSTGSGDSRGTKNYRDRHHRDHLPLRNQVRVGPISS